MEYRHVGDSGLEVSELSFGTATFGGAGEFFSAWGTTGVAEARELVDVCLDAGVTTFDTADVYSDGRAEQVLGEALKGRRDRAVISTKASLPMGDGPMSAGASRSRLLRCVDDALRRLQTDRVDLFQLHAWDAYTPIEETMGALDDAVTAGKIRYVGVSNYAGWQLMSAVSTAQTHGFVRPVAHQVYYSLIGRDYEWELMPAGHAQGVGALVWSPLGWGRLTGRIRRNAPAPQSGRLPATAAAGPPVDQATLFDVVDALTDIAAETGHTVPQVAINWLLRRPTVASVIVGARTADQLRDNLGAVGWELDSEQVARLDSVSLRESPYPYFPYRRQAGFARVSPPLV